MTQEDKEILLKDLCARLPYKPIVHIDDCGIWDLLGIDHDDSAELRDRVIVWHGKNYPSSKNSFPIINCKPYLFPLSSMSEKQKQEFLSVAGYETREEDCGRHTETYYYDMVGHEHNFYPNCDAIDWLNKNHFDYRGLIEKGLALHATGLNIY